MVLEGLSRHVTQADPCPTDGICQIDVGIQRQAPFVPGFHDDGDVFDDDPFELEGEGQYASEVNWLIRKGESTELSFPVPIQVRYPLEREHFVKTSPEVVIAVYTSVEGQEPRIRTYEDDERCQGQLPHISPMADCEFLNEHAFSLNYEALSRRRSAETEAVEIRRGTDGKEYGVTTILLVLKAHHHGGVVVRIDDSSHHVLENCMGGVRIDCALPPQARSLRD
jgi:hypothetical protein